MSIVVPNQCENYAQRNSFGEMLLTLATVRLEKALVSAVATTVVRKCACCSMMERKTCFVHIYIHIYMGLYFMHCYKQVPTSECLVSARSRTWLVSAALSSGFATTCS